MALPLVEIIILNYRMREQVGDCLLSLRRLTYANYRIVVVDNDSGDGIREMLKTDFPEVIFIQTGENGGYTGGNNRGLAHAIGSGADYALILNPDTVLVNPGLIEEMVEQMEADRKLGIAGPRVFLRHAGDIQNTVLYPPGLARNIVNWFRFRLAPSSLNHSGDRPLEAEVLNGVCLLIRVECLEQIGLFDERYFMYIEDADMDYRARLAGWGIRYLPIDSVIHRQKLDGYHPTGMVGFLLKQNSVYYLIKRRRRLDALGYAILSLGLMWVRGFVSLRHGVAGFREHLGFCRRLHRAYCEIFRRGVPPVGGWRE